MSPLTQDSQALNDKQLTDSPKSDLASCLALLAQKYPDLALVVKAWPNLPDETKTAILALAQPTFTRGKTP
jgi:hypothetical protein